MTEHADYPEIAVRDEPDVGAVVATLSDRHDFVAGKTEELREQLAATFERYDEIGRKYLVLDLTDVDALDSSGLSLLLGLQREVESSDAELLLVVPPSIAGLFAVTNLTAVFPMFDTADEALASIGTFRGV